MTNLDDNDASTNPVAISIQPKTALESNRGSEHWQAMLEVLRRSVNKKHSVGSPTKMKSSHNSSPPHPKEKEQPQKPDSSDGVASPNRCKSPTNSLKSPSLSAEWIQLLTEGIMKNLPAFTGSPPQAETAIPPNSNSCEQADGSNLGIDMKALATATAAALAATAATLGTRMRPEANATTSNAETDDISASKEILSGEKLKAVKKTRPMLWEKSKGTTQGTASSSVESGSKKGIWESSLKTRGAKKEDISGSGKPTKSSANTSSIRKQSVPIERGSGLTRVGAIQHLREFSCGGGKPPGWKPGDGEDVVLYARDGTPVLPNKIFVGGLSQAVDSRRLREYFAPYGQIIDAFVSIDESTRRSRGFGFVTFTDVRSVHAALNSPAPHCLDGRIVECKAAFPRGTQANNPNSGKLGPFAPPSPTKFTRGQSQPTSSRPCESESGRQNCVFTYPYGNFTRDDDADRTDWNYGPTEKDTFHDPSSFAADSMTAGNYDQLPREDSERSQMESLQRCAYHLDNSNPYLSNERSFISSWSRSPPVFHDSFKPRTPSVSMNDNTNTLNNEGSPSNDSKNLSPDPYQALQDELMFGSSSSCETQQMRVSSNEDHMNSSPNLSELQNLLRAEHLEADNYCGISNKQIIDADTLSSGDIYLTGGGRSYLALSGDKWLQDCAEADERKIFVGGLPDVTPAEFAQHFEKFGPVSDAMVMFDRRKKRQRGFGFITFATMEGVERSLVSSRHPVKSKSVEVKKAHPLVIQKARLPARAERDRMLAEERKKEQEKHVSMAKDETRKLDKDGITSFYEPKIPLASIPNLSEISRQPSTFGGNGPTGNSSGSCRAKPGDGSGSVSDRPIKRARQREPIADFCLESDKRQQQQPPDLDTKNNVNIFQPQQASPDHGWQIQPPGSKTVQSNLQRSAVNHSMSWNEGLKQSCQPWAAQHLAAWNPNGSNSTRPRLQAASSASHEDPFHMPVQSTPPWSILAAPAINGSQGGEGVPYQTQWRWQMPPQASTAPFPLVYDESNSNDRLRQQKLTENGMENSGINRRGNGGGGTTGGAYQPPFHV